jgi:hypothetical protein
MRELTLLVPGLAGPRENRAMAFAELRLPVLERLLARADRVQAAPATLETALARVFGFAAGDAGEGAAAVAPLALLGETGVRAEGWWLRADPVHIQAGLDKAVMLGAGGLAITPAEAEALCAELAAQMAEEGVCPQPRSPARWYLSWPQPPLACFAPLPAVIGADLYPHLPQGEDGRLWRRLLNHAQMVLHASEVNARRAAAGRPQINGLWFWGGGARPAPRDCAPDGALAAVWSDDPYAHGLALNAGMSRHDLPGDAGAWLDTAGEGRHLATIDRLREPLGLADVEGWCARMEEVYELWLEPLGEALERGVLAGLRVCPGDGAEYHISGRALRRRWWRRRRGLNLALPA